MGMYTTRMLSVLVAVGTVVSCHTYASDRAVIEVRGDSKAEVMWFRSGAVLFTDRGYRLADCPAALAGEKFLRSSIDSTRVRCGARRPSDRAHPSVHTGRRLSGRGPRETGFVRTKEDRFQLFGTREIDQVLVYEKQVASGESYRFGKWVVVLGFEDARSAKTGPVLLTRNRFSSSLRTSPTRECCSWTGSRKTVPDTATIRLLNAGTGTSSPSTA